jgi:hypothetical protein
MKSLVEVITGDELNSTALLIVPIALLLFYFEGGGGSVLFVFTYNMCLFLSHIESLSQNLSIIGTCLQNKLDLTDLSLCYLTDFLFSVQHAEGHL